MPELVLVDPDFADTAPRVVRVERVIDVSPAQVWNCVLDTSGWTEWFPTMSRADSMSPPATHGSSRTVKIGLLVAEEQVVVADEPLRWGFSVTHTNIPIAKRLLELLDLEDASTTERARCRVRYTGAFEPLWFNRPLFGLVTRNVARSWRHGLDGLADHLTAP
jgi:hypothetical protein